MLRTSPFRLLQCLVLWLIVLLIGCGGGGSTAPDPVNPDPDTNGGQPGPDPDDGGGGGGGGGGGIPTTDADVRSGVTNGNGVVELPAFGKASPSSRAGKAATFQLADAFGTPLANVLVVNVRQGNEFVGAIIPNTPDRAPRFFFSQKIPDRVITGEESREGAMSPGDLGVAVSSALNIAVEGNTIIVKLNLEQDATLDASGIGENARYFGDNDLLNRVLSFGNGAGFEGVYNQAQLGNRVAELLDNGGGYFYLAGLIEEGGLLGNWRLGAALETNPNDVSFRKFLEPISNGGTQNTYFQQQLAASEAANRTSIRSAFDTVFASRPMSLNLTGAQRYLLIAVKPADAVPTYDGENQNVLIAVPVAPRALSLNGTDNTNIFQVSQPKGLQIIGNYTFGSSQSLAPNTSVNEGLSARTALTMTPLRSGDALTRPGFAPTLTAVDELQRNLKASYFIPDYFGDPSAYPQNQLLEGCTTCTESPLFSVVGPNGAITNLLPVANIGLVSPITGSGRLTNNQLPVTVSTTGTSDADGNIVKVTINWGDGTPNTVVTDSIDLNATYNHTYTSAGTFTIRLTVEDDGDPLGQASDTVQVTAIANANPDLCLSFSTPEIVDGEIRGEVPFTPELSFSCSSDSDSDILATGRITVVFGDGPVLNNEPFNIYANLIQKPYINPGEYTFTATLTDIDGGTDVFTVQIIAEAPPENQLPIAVAEADPTTGEAPLTVNFSSANSSDPDGTITSTIWNFGDPAVSGGGVSILPNPTYTYIQADTLGEGYTATLLVVDDSGLGNPFDRASDSVVITVNEPSNLPPVVVVDAPAVAEVGQPIQFSSANSTDPEGNNLVGYAWDFGDGNTSAEANPIHTYANPPKEGFFFVTLQITDDGDPPRVGFGEKQVQVISAFDADVPFAIIEPVGPTFGEGSLNLSLDASASFSPVGNDIVSYDWQFTDDSSTDSGSTVSHNFTVLGNHSVILTVTDEFGKQGSTAIPIFISDSPPFGLGARVIARATANPIEVLVGTPIQFFSTGTHDPEGENVDIVGWDFGDTQTSEEDNPSHSFGAPGLYLVTMVASEELPAPDQSRWVSATVLVRVTDSAPNIPPVGIIGVDTYSAAGGPAIFNFSADLVTDVDGSVPETNILWDFGDGGTDTGSTVAHQYNDAGVFDVTLTITDDGGAFKQTNCTVAVGPHGANVAPLIDIQVGSASLITSTSEAYALDLTASFDIELEDITWAIDFGDGSAIQTSATPLYTYPAPGAYTITVQATDETGDRTIRSFPVLVAGG